MPVFVISPHGGLIQRGNIDLTARPVVRNRDGTISTVASRIFGTELDGKEVSIVLTSVFNKKRYTNDEAIWGHYERTGQHLGIFDTLANAKRYAEALHRWQARYYRDRKRRRTQ